MSKFLKLFWMGFLEAFDNIKFIIIALLPYIISFGIAVIIGSILKESISMKFAVIFACIAGAFTFCIYNIISHCIDAIKYLKESNTDSLKEAWRETTPTYLP